MIRRTLCYVLALATLVVGYLWIDSYRGRPISTGHDFHGWCADLPYGDTSGFHMIVRVGGLCVSHRSPVKSDSMPSEMDLTVTQNLGLFWYDLSAYKPCPLNAKGP